MDKKPLIVVSICAVVLLFLASLTNVVGYQTVQSSNQKTINDVIDQKELLFQTIVDIVNNKDIQRIIFKFQISKDGFLNPNWRLYILNTPVLTKNQLEHMYIVGLMLSKTISKSKIHSMVEQYHLNNKVKQKEITTVIEKNATLKAEMNQLSNLKCDCENENKTQWSFPVLCTLLYPLYLLLSLFAFGTNIVFDILKLDRNNPLIFLLYIIIIFPFAIIYEIGWRLNCFWGWKIPTTR